jgi:glucosylglycerate phosphorylase
MNQVLLGHLTFLFGPARAVDFLEKLLTLISCYQSWTPSPKVFPGNTDERTVTEKDAVLITLGDMVFSHGTPPLLVPGELLDSYSQDLVSTVHLLPFYQYSSDDGFAVIDYKAVNPALGSWEDVGRIGRHFRLMIDAVINHLSAESDWFQDYFSEKPQYSDYFISVNEDCNFSSVSRPRDLPLFSQFKSKTCPQ